MAILLKEDTEIELPKMQRVTQKFNENELASVSQTLADQLERMARAIKFKKGDRIAIAVGSRGIKEIDLIVKTLVDHIKATGAEPFIITAMGSHGDGTKEGQLAILTSFNITEKFLGVDIVSSVEVEDIGQTEAGIPVYFDSVALEADYIIPVNRIKIHTDFIGKIQSGLSKMLVIGLGNHKGCSAIHEMDPEYFVDILIEASEIIKEKVKIPFGVGIVENAYGKPLIVEAIKGKDFLARESELVEVCKKNMPRLMVDDIDILIVEKIGKNISGAGFDPNIIGRSPILKEYIMPIPKIGKIILLGLTKESHGNAIGAGLFDFMLKNVFDDMDLDAMYANSLACKSIEDSKIPMLAGDEKEAICMAVKSSRGINLDNLRIVKIKNTSELDEILVSEAYLEEVKASDGMEISLGGGVPWELTGK